MIVSLNVIYEYPDSKSKCEFMSNTPSGIWKTISYYIHKRHYIAHKIYLPWINQRKHALCTTRAQILLTGPSLAYHDTVLYNMHYKMPVHI